MIQIIDPRDFDHKARWIRTRVSGVLTKWGLLPRFKRWRLTQDPDSGMIVLFGVLNHRYVAAHTSIPFIDYFDPRLLRDLADELHLQVVSCNSDGLRYAFILDRGQLETLPTHIDFPFVDDGKLLVRIVYGDALHPLQSAPAEAAVIDDHVLVQRGVKAFLKVFDDIKLRDDAALLLSAQNPPTIAVIDEDEFYKRVAEHEANRQRNKRIDKLIGHITREKIK